ncbi:unnamed protein product, partial [Tetraodon nigroviridis]
MSKKAKFKPGAKKRENKCIVMFDDKHRQEYLTGFHKRKVERRKAAVAEIHKKIKEEQTRVREERHKEYLKMLKERNEALEAAEDDLEDAITSTTESVQYDHPNHTVTVTTINDLDLTGANLFGSATPQVNADEDEEKKEDVQETTEAMPRKARNPVTNKKIRSLTASLSTFTSKRKRKGKQESRRGQGHPPDNRRSAFVSKHKKKTSKSQRRRKTGKR